MLFLLSKREEKIENNQQFIIIHLVREEDATPIPERRPLRKVRSRLHLSKTPASDKPIAVSGRGDSIF